MVKIAWRNRREERCRTRPERSDRLGRRRSCFALAAACAGLLLPGQSGAGGSEVEDSCVDCHRDANFLVTHKKLYAYFQEWSTSIHRQEEVSCSGCHGGDPSKPDKKGAHRGKISGSAPRSAVNFENIPSTCGKCHDDVYQGYRESPHFEHLIASQEEAQGPNCVTCHGSINSAALNVNTVKNACSQCHNEDSENHPEIPDQAKLLLNKFLAINRYYRYITIRGEPSETRAFFEALDAEIRSLSVEWHTFDLEKIGEKTRAVLASLKGKRVEVRKKQLEQRESE